MGLPYYECFDAAEYVLDALADIGEHWSCLIGGMAAKLHGVDRVVKDLDIAILRPDSSEEDIQDALVDYDSSRFYLERPRDRRASFYKLMYRIPDTTHVIKVDLLLGDNSDAEIPRTFHRNHFVEIDGLRVAPLYFVLYHKLLGWDLRTDDRRLWKRNQANEKDYPDIIALCKIIYRLGMRPLSKGHMGREYLDNYQRRAEFIASYYNDSDLARRQLRRIGFNV
ncbi:hypothetical protein FRC20_002734 [Serendipita sp. 405]|nr:hypothetical protein FRC20_002734 [Serendipita sp. 405]